MCVYVWTGIAGYSANLASVRSDVELLVFKFNTQASTPSTWCYSSSFHRRDEPQTFTYFSTLG